jgi:hypothetical protein
MPFLPVGKTHKSDWPVFAGWLLKVHHHTKSSLGFSLGLNLEAMRSGRKAVGNFRKILFINFVCFQLLARGNVEFRSSRMVRGLCGFPVTKVLNAKNFLILRPITVAFIIFSEYDGTTPENPPAC